MASKKFNLQDPAANIIGMPAASEPPAEEKPEQEVGDVARAWEEAGRPQPPAGHVLNRAYVETTSRKVQVLMQPSLHTRIKEQAARDGVSVNEMISRLIVAGLDAREG